MFINNKFNLGDIVYLITDIDQRARIITGIKVRMNDLLVYELACNCEETNHFEVEISSEKNILIMI
jgi:hypothetical protein